MSTIAVNQITDMTGISAPVFPAGSAQLNPMAGREDKIINGDFGIWQRGTSGTNQVYVADRWSNFSSSGTITNSRQEFTIGDTLGSNQPASFLRATVSGQSAASSVAYISQRIEGVRSYAGQTITVLGWARRSSGAGNIAFEGYQNFGTGGTFSGAINSLGVTTVPLVGTWQPFAVTVTFPSLTGMNIGTSGTDHAGIVFWTSAGSDFNARTNSLGIQNIGVDLWGIHIRHGTWTAAATADYRQRDLGTEFALCQRYYETGVATLIASYSGGNFGGGHTRVYYNVRKRALPSSLTAVKISGVGLVATLNAGNDSLSGCGVWFNGSAVTGDYMNFTYVADAELY